MWFFKKKNIDYDKIVSIVENGNETDIKNLLWQPKQGQVNYLPVATTMIQKLKKSNSSDKGLSIFKTIEKGNYELIIFNTPWHEDDLPFYPLIIDKVTEKVVGIMLPFNELHNHLSKRDNSAIGDLGIQWVKFTMDYRFKK
jgi:hypothetical protein